MNGEISCLKRNRDNSAILVTVYQLDDGDWISGGGRVFPFSPTSRSVSVKGVPETESK
jgi:hypothetical protein